jgi:hypothetical protein
VRGCGRRLLDGLQSRGVEGGAAGRNCSRDIAAAGCSGSIGGKAHSEAGSDGGSACERLDGGYDDTHHPAERGAGGHRAAAAGF